MANAGYGNHTDESIPQKGAPESGAVSDKAPADPAGPGTKADKTAASPKPEDRHDQATPGSGAMPDGAQGGDVDPGVG